MDWPCAEGAFNDHHFGNFKYFSGQSFKITRKLQSDEKPQSWDIKSHEHLKEWIEKHECWLQKEGESGMVAILFSRCEKSGYSHPSYLPVTQGGFSELIRLFHIHSAIVRTIRREASCFSHIFPYCQDPNAYSIVYTARMSSRLPNDIAMSSTYLIDRGLNLSVFYGCSQQQSSVLIERLGKAGNAIIHPMIASGIFAELDRARLFEYVSEATDSFVSSTETLCCQPSILETNIYQKGPDITQLSDLYVNTRELMKAIRKVKCQISDMRSHICDLHRKKSKVHMNPRSTENARAKLNTHRNISSYGVKIHGRLLEIETECEDRLNSCHIIPESLAFTAQMVSNHSNTHIAMDSQKKNTQMRTIALMTMIYLPVTSLASIFSMGVFNWGANADQSVLTFYFWVYVVIAVGLTVLTIGTWWVLTRTRRRQYDRETDIEKLM